MITVYHNARCKKSREGLEIVKNSGKDYEVREYLKEPLSETELKQILDKLSFYPMQLIRTNEKIWKEEYKNKIHNLNVDKASKETLDIERLWGEDYKGNKFVRLRISKKEQPDKFGKNVNVVWNDPSKIKAKTETQSADDSG